MRSDPSATGVGDLLVRHALEQAKRAGLEVAVAVSRCQQWDKRSGVSLLRHAKAGRDSGVAFHTSRGAEVVRVVDGWRPEDEDNEGSGVLVRYQLPGNEFVPTSLYDR